MSIPKKSSSFTAEDIFNTSLFHDLSSRDGEFITPSAQKSLSASLWQFLKVRKSREHKVRVVQYQDQSLRSFSGVEIITADKPFIVDSVTRALTRLKSTPTLVLHPVYTVKRSESHEFQSFCEEGEKHPIRESVTLVLIPAVHSKKRIRAIEKAIVHVLKEVTLAVKDWKRMRARCKQIMREIAKSPHVQTSALEFLKWLEGDHFIFLGYRSYAHQKTAQGTQLQVIDKSGLGILRHAITEDYKKQMFMATSAELEDFISSPDMVLVSKTTRRSVIHRDAFMDVICIKNFDEAGSLLGEHRFVGLFTSKAYSSSVFSVPLLKQKVDSVIHDLGYAPASHNRKALVHILETYPRDNLFAISAGDLKNIARGILQMQDRRQTAMFLQNDRFGRHVSCLVYLPREEVSTGLRHKIEKLLTDRFQGRVSDYSLSITEQRLARYHYIIETPKGIPQIDITDLRREVEKIAFSWIDSYHEELLQDILQKSGQEQAEKELELYGDIFSVPYQEQNSTQTARHDLKMLKRLKKENPVAVSLLSQEVTKGVASLHVRLYHYDRSVSLAQAMPILENLGVVVISEYSHEFKLPGDRHSLWLHDFNILGGGVYDHEEDREVAKLFEEGFVRIWKGEVENDTFNALILKAGLDVDQIRVLRSYFCYLKQGTFALSRTVVAKTFSKFPLLTALIIDLFETRFDPAFKGARHKKYKTLYQEILKQIDDLQNANDDRIFRSYVEAIHATQRTNFYQARRFDLDLPEKPLAFKIESAGVSFLPFPRPMAEIFVSSPRVEGVHLRGGKIARGGIRWSDRFDDFRTEVLSLMKAQMVKNSVIVPVGSKGGFICKRLSGAVMSREDTQKEVVTCYRLFISALLDLTDNRSGDIVIPPQGVVCHDGEDPYLVVAADKGTASFSDIANALSLAYGFWLKDAFASGGSAGYDHKKMGITARGAWISVTRHFREMGHDIAQTPFTVIGVGDMSGDVFGNGMLLSRQIKLIAAFNHRHIFIDPNPNPEISFKERERIFNLGRVSSWDEYQETLLSKGGRVFDRNAKDVKLTSEIKKLLGIKTDKISPSELIKLILQLKADLLWLGGIGTYVKASTETHADADDRSNDALRIDAHKLRVSVVGEGANLGFTQRARIEYAARGGRINTDAIDNSAGVDTSDHEVNIKIALNQEIDKGNLDLKKRNTLLQKMTDDVAALVLRDNELQTLALSRFASAEGESIETARRLMRMLERKGLLNRSLERLPDNETIETRAKEGKPLLRPEYAVLMAYAKIDLFNALMEEEALFSEHVFNPIVLSYFPDQMQKIFHDPILNHPLRAGLIATVLSNRIVNRMGAGFVFTMADQTKTTAHEVLKSYQIAEALFDMESICREIESLDNQVSPEVQKNLFDITHRLMSRTTLWFLTHRRGSLEIKSILESFEKPARQLKDAFLNVVPASHQSRIIRFSKTYERAGVPHETAEKLAVLSRLHRMCDIIQIAVDTHLPIQQVARIYFRLRADFRFDWLIKTGLNLVFTNDTERRAMDQHLDELAVIKARLTRSVIDLMKKSNLSDDLAMAHWQKTNADLVAGLKGIVLDLQQLKTPKLAAFTLALGHLRALSLRV